MYLIRLLIIFLALVQFTSSIENSSASSSPFIVPSVSTTTIKPKTTSSFSRHLNKLLTPFKKLFSSKPKLTTQQNQTSPANSTDLQLDDLNNQTFKQTFNKDSVDQLLLNATFDETNQTNAVNTSDINDLNVSDSIDFNLTEEINLKEATNSIVDPVKVDEDKNKIDSFKHEEEIVTNSIHLVSTSTMTYRPINVQATTTSIPIETTTNLVYRKKSQSLKEDETKICFEIEELNIRKCYIQVPNSGNFLQSRNYCETHFQHGRLITMNTAEEENFLIINSVYYFWTSFQVKLGLTLDLVPKIAAIKPAYKQSNNSIELIKKFDFNQNLVINPNDKISLTENDKIVSYPTNDEDEYEPDDIRLDHQGKDQLIVLVPKLYCLEASLSFENGKPLYKWIVKDCNHESSSSVCELSEQLVEEDTDSTLLSENKSEELNDREIRIEKKSEEKEDMSKFVDESVNKLVNQFLYEKSNKTGNDKPLLNRQFVTESDDDTLTESSDDEHFKAILPDILKDLAQSTTPVLVDTKTEKTEQTSQNSVNSLTTTELTKPIELITSTFASSTVNSTFSSSTTEHSTLATTTLNYGNETDRTAINSTDQSTDNPITTTLRTTDTDCKTEKNPLVYQFVFAVNIAFNSFCSLVANLFKKNALDDDQMKHTKLVFLSALILLLILLLTIILLIIILVFRFLIRRFRTKRRLLLEELSEKKFSSVLDKKFDDFYYNVPHHQSRTCRNIYVSDYKVGLESNLLNNNNFITRKNEISSADKYQSIPKEYFY